MKTFKVEYRRTTTNIVVDIVEAETMEEAIKKSKEGNILSSTEDYDGIIEDEFGHKLTEVYEND